MCPVCGEILPAHARGRTFHAEGHDMTAEDLARRMLGTESTCQCGCGKETLWRGWSKGFSKFLRGHMSTDSRSSGIEKLRSSLRTNHWSRGLSKETSAVLMDMSRKISKKIKSGFADGTISHWSKGQTAKNDSRVAAAAKKRSETLRGKNHWHFLPSDEVADRIINALGDRFEIISGLESISDRTNNATHHVEIRCKACGRVTSPSVYGIIRNEKKVCLSCRTEASSVPQLEIEDFVRSMIGDKTVLSSDRSNATGYELDVYIPSACFAIEYNGLYWHSEGARKDRDYHNRKTESCRKEGISLLHVFQDEWRDKREVVESMIINRLGLSKKVWARKCEIAEMSSSESRSFFEENHIDGDVRGIVTYGLFFEGKAVSAIKLRRPHSKRWSGFLEIARYACIKGTDVVGGHSRLIKHVQKKHSERLISYVDARFGGTGRHCEMSGMILDHVSKHSFWWTDREKRYNRLYCRAADGRSETEEASRRKLLKIWGCSNYVFVTP